MNDESQTSEATPTTKTAAPLIHSAMVRVMAEVGAIGKNRKNQAQGYQFRGIDDLYNAVQPALVKAGVYCMPTVLDRSREERPSKSGGVMFTTILTVRLRFTATDGSFVDAVTIGEAMDSGDKSTNKAMSAAQKYALLEALCIPTEEPKDSENDSPEPAPRNASGHREDKKFPAPQKPPRSEATLEAAMKVAETPAALASLAEEAKGHPEDVRLRLRTVYSERHAALAAKGKAA